MYHEADPIKFYQMMFFEGGDAIRMSPQEWAQKLSKGLQQMVDDPLLSFHYIEPHLIHVCLTLEGAEKVMEHLHIRDYFPDAEIEANPLSDNPSESDYGYWVTFTHHLGDDEISEEDEERELEGIELVEDFCDLSKCAVLTFANTDEEDINAQRCYLHYELNYIMAKEDERVSVFTDAPIYLDVLKEYYNTPELEYNTLRVLTNYLTYVFTHDLLMHVDGYEKGTS